MPQIDRFSVSLDTELLAAFDRHIASKGYGNRSEAVRDMIRELLVASRLDTGDEGAVSILTVVCDHRFGSAAERLRSCALSGAELVCGSLVVPLDAHRDAVTMAFRGQADRLQTLNEQIQAMRGITDGRLVILPIAEPTS